MWQLQKISIRSSGITTYHLLILFSSDRRHQISHHHKHSKRNWKIEKAVICPLTVALAPFLSLLFSREKIKANIYDPHSIYSSCYSINKNRIKNHPAVDLQCLLCYMFSSSSSPIFSFASSCQAPGTSKLVPITFFLKLSSFKGAPSSSVLSIKSCQCYTTGVNTISGIFFIRTQKAKPCFCNAFF